jgi:hypothetical protein
MGYAIAFLVCRNGFTHPTNNCASLLTLDYTYIESWQDKFSKRRWRKQQVKQEPAKTPLA